MNTIELARKAGALLVNGKVKEMNADALETFRRLCIEDFVKGVDVEPDSTLVKDAVAHAADLKDGFIKTDHYGMLYTHSLILKLVSALAAQRSKALEEAAEVCDGRATYYDQGDDDRPDTRRGRSARACADAIRALKEKK